MNVLAVETSSERLSVALALGELRLHRSMKEGTRHSEHILEVVRLLLHEAGTELAALDALAFGAGPGAFTGIRLGCGVAQGLGLALTVPVVAVNSLQALAEGVRQIDKDPRKGHGDTVRMLAAVDARLGEIYYSGWQWQRGEWSVVLGTAIATPDSVPIPGGTDWIGCGNAFEIHRDAIQARLGRSLASVASVGSPDALAVLSIALVELAAGRGQPPEAALPIYVRDKVALTTAERAMRYGSK